MLPFDRNFAGGVASRPSIVSVLRQSVRNDPFDLCFERSSEVLGGRAAVAADRPGPWQIVKRFVGVFWLALQALREPRTYARPIQRKIFIVATSDNQVHAVQPVVDRLGAAAVAGDRAFGEWIRRRASLYALPFLPVLILRCLRATAYQRATLPASFSNYWLSYGLFLAACVMLRDRPSLVVLSSDHTTLPRTMAFAARFLGIPTAFIPHAGVTKGLPPLCFDAAFLDGLHAAQQYARAGPSNTVVFLAGVPRLDAILQRPPRESRRLAVCPALRDDAASVLELLSQAITVLPAGAVTIRPHPKEPAKQRYVQAALALGCVYSDAQKEPAGNVLQTVDIVVCGDSHLIAEARVARRWVVFFAPRGATGDQYGYIADGLPHAICRNGDDLLAFLSNAATKSRPPADGLDVYMATLGTLWEGRSTELIATTLLDLSNGRSQPGSIAWEPLGSAPAGSVFLPPRNPDGRRSADTGNAR
jgi:hypothetical protein